MPNEPSRLQLEIRQRLPFRSRSHEAGLGLLRTADLLRNRLTDVMEREGVTLQQYNVLRILRGAGKDGLPTLEIADRMIERAPGITRLLDRLEARGLVERERCPTDRRQVTCRVTSPGLDVIDRLETPLDAEDHRFSSVLSSAELDTLITLLDRLRAGRASQS